MYKQYLEAMEKKIHDEKMERFKEHAKKVKEAAEKNKEVVETAPPSAPKSQIDNGRNNKESPPVKISISPTRKTSLQKSPFEVKKTKFNHFTGKSLCAEGKKEIEMKMPEDRDPSLYVQVGEQKCVFKYGERNDAPRLIESVISYIKDEDEKGQKTLFTQTLRRNRSASEEAFFSKQNRKLSIEKGSGAYGLTGASDLESSEIQEKQP